MTKKEEITDNKTEENKKETTKKDKNALEESLSLFLKVPGLKVNRTSYLTSLFQKTKPELSDKLDKKSLKSLGFTKDDAANFASKEIKKGMITTSIVSFLAGLPGFAIGAATIPADILQFYANILLTSQKLLYIYNWRDISDNKILFKKLLVLTLGVMLDIEGSDKALKKLYKKTNSIFFKFKTNSKFLSKLTLSSKLILSHSIKQIQKKIMLQISKKSTTKLAGRAVIIVGGLLSGNNTRIEFNNMIKKLQDVLISIY